ncbi:DNA repair protein RecO (recombination protein O) [Parabacteroides sp. PF5-5]|uniref:DNA repair protein RecO n=1 Tax=unclassified Parabacteroides TaxID=2649774 RepID=UPI0024734390|nr:MULTISPECIES: DNA repair protein RecO [unclassified Parabacteroides]MDH6303412.1 DNA repair protein RecO (recombination protein O) [Parabacteroides sp. PH5-39]MDH6314735.1 DNA repair protein RecO (recombination protein O) [Parabacteroides sp. PF5-13]MDH6318072.1 DNA repair protein RecO (recombination protein O) [Parabacteroides sp. PH5-13]MDH6321997.1 DNA repair protein RecO (recombination protein O) [Parabacteroides sp. PH5-8]MDH6326120.1 DNA repair protein RecO (recombination protein O) [
MLSKTRGIVLHSIPYNDTYSIIYMYTEAFGRASYLVARGRGKKTAVSKALFMPLSVLDMEVEHQNKRDLHRIRETKLCYPLTQLSCDPVKNVLALFIAEVLFRVVKETEPDARLFDYLYRSIYVLEISEGGVANYHLVFLLHLLSYLGVFPNVDSYIEGYYFDMQNGVFVDRPPMHRHYLSREESQIFSRLFKISYENMSLYAFSRQDRVNILHRILTYYRLHLPEIPEIKSIAILQTLFE